jgi:diguanylate cyclase
MSENPDWKQKYRDSVAEMEAGERRWQQIEKVLRRLVNRLCAAGMGVDARLDEELAAVAAANRRNADVMELETLAAALTSAVAAVDVVAPVVPIGRAAGAKNPAGERQERAARWDSTCAAAGVLLERLALIGADDSGAGALKAELTQAKTDSDLAAILLRTADLIHERAGPLARDRQQAATLLAEVGKRLGELSEYFSAASGASRARLEDTASLDSSVMQQVRELSQETHAATDLHSLRSLVATRLESVGQSVREFRSREEARLVEQTARADEMRSRVAALEYETRELNEKLDAERRRARVDPLTAVPNRKAFDERIAQEIARRAHTSGPVTLLVWDIDNFKAINDSYGHRAGDRVLQHVARCLARGIRSTDFIARIGGEEFTIVMIGLAMEVAIRIANDLRASVEALRFHFRGVPVRVTVSCGITELKDTDGAESAFDRADAALYRAKNGGKNACIAA